MDKVKSQHKTTHLLKQTGGGGGGGGGGGEGCLVLSSLWL